MSIRAWLADKNRISFHEVVDVFEHDGVRHLVVDRHVDVAVSPQDTAAHDHTPRDRGAVLGDVDQSRTGADETALALAGAEGREAVDSRHADELDAVTGGVGLNREVVWIEGNIDTAARQRQAVPGVPANQLLLQLTGELHVTSSQTSDNITQQLNVPIHHKDPPQASLKTQLMIDDLSTILS